MTAFPGTGCSAEFRIRAVEARDEARLLEMFNRTFGTESSTGLPRSPGHWHWKYHEGPLGNWSRLVERGDGSIVAHCGCLPLAVDADGREAVTVQSVDLMSTSEGLQRSSKFGRLLTRCAEVCVKNDRAMFGYGFPSRAALRIGQRVARYGAPSNVTLLHGHLERERCAGAAALEVTDEGVVPPDVDALWSRCRRRDWFVVRRDSRYLSWRYERHPVVRYRILQARDRRTGALRGLAVYRSGGVASDVATILEWLVPDGEEEGATALLEALARVQQSNGPAGFVVWIRRMSDWHRWFLARGFVARTTDCVFVVRSFTAGLEAEAIRPRLYMTLGDIDYY